MKQNKNMYPNYPVYPMPNPNIGPNPMPMPMPNPNMMTNYDYDNKMQEEINDLKRRVTALEKTVNNTNYNSTKFTDSNYHMM